MSTVLCANGHPITDGLQFCTTCGHPAVAAPATPEAVQPAPVSMPTPAVGTYPTMQVPQQAPGSQWAHAGYPMAALKPPSTGRIPLIAGIGMVAFGLFLAYVGPLISVSAWVNSAANCTGWNCEPSNPMGALWGWIGTGVAVIAVGVGAFLYGLNRILARKEN